MKKYILGMLLLGALVGCGKERYMEVKDWQAPTHPNEAPITYELFARKAIEFATPEDDILTKEDIIWSVEGSPIYDASLVASYGDRYRVYINISGNTVKNLEMVHGNTVKPLEEVIRNRKVQVLKEMRIPQSEFVDFLCFDQNAQAKTVKDMCIVLLQFPQKKPIRVEDIVYKFVGETKDGFTMRALHGGDYVEVSCRYDGQMLRYSASDITIYYNDYGHVLSLPEIDKGFNNLKY